MRRSAPHRRRRYRQRRRGYAAAVLCLGVFVGCACGALLVEHRPSAYAADGPGGPNGAKGPRGAGGSPGAGHLKTPHVLPLPAPQPVASRAAGYVVGSGQSGSGTGAGSGAQNSAGPSSGGGAGQRPSGSGAAPSVPSAVPNASPISLDPGAFLDASAQPPGSPMTVSDPLNAVPFAGLPQVGAIFGYSGGSVTSHFCSGSVVDSTAGDIVITAAHCVYDSSAGSYLSNLAFVPGYHDGQQPYGVWNVSQILVAQQWLDSADPDYDVAFLVVHRAGSTQRVQDAVGGDRLAVNPQYSTLVQVVGYPSDTEEPITCDNETKQFSATQLEFDCGGYPAGTSGGPFLSDVDAQTGVGTVMGVLGGYETGGDTPDVSYSSYFGDAVAALFEQAEAAG